MRGADSYGTMDKVGVKLIGIFGDGYLRSPPQTNEPRP